MTWVDWAWMFLPRLERPCHWACVRRWYGGLIAMMLRMAASGVVRRTRTTVHYEPGTFPEMVAPWERRP